MKINHYNFFFKICHEDNILIFISELSDNLLIFIWRWLIVWIDAIQWKDVFKFQKSIFINLNPKKASDKQIIIVSSIPTLYLYRSKLLKNTNKIWKHYLKYPIEARWVFDPIKLRERSEREQWSVEIKDFSACIN